MGLLTDLISKVGLDTRDFQKELDRTTRKLERSGRRMSLVGNDLTQNVSLPILAMGGFAIKSAADIERLELALKNTMGAGYIDELAKLTELAKDPGLGFEQAVRGSVALQAVGESAETSRKILQEWGNAVAAAGGTAHNLDRVVVQLQQALSKQGNLLREDWKFIVQQAPQAQKAMMDLYGTGSTEELAKQGVTAKQAIMDITNELAKLGRVEGGIANAFVNFQDELKQTLAPLGKMIFESSELRNVMNAIIGMVTKAAKAFGSLSPEMQKFAVQAAVGLAALGPGVRLLGSVQLVAVQLVKALGGGALALKKFADYVGHAQAQTGPFSRSLVDFNKRFAMMPRNIALVAGALGGLAAAAAAAFASVKIGEIFASKMGEISAKNPNSIWAKIFDPNFFVLWGGNAAQKWVEGFASEAAKNKQELQKGIDQAVETLNLTGIFDDQSTQGNEIWSESELENRAKKAADAMKSPWSKAMQELNKEMSAISQMEILLGKNQNAERYAALWDMITEGLFKFGMAADDSRIVALQDRMKAIRGEIQGIAAHLPALSNLPTALSPTGGLPNLGANNVMSIAKDQRIWSEQTMFNNGLMSVKALNAGYTEGLMTYGEAVKALTKKYGLEMGKELAKGLDNGMVEQGPALMESLSKLATDVKTTLAAGFGEAIGSIVGGENPLKAFAQNLIIPLTEVLKQFGQLLIAAGTARVALSSLAVTGIGSIVAGGALIAASGAVKSFMQNKLTSLAEGGIATGPTPALVGDNPRSPELITPLHKLPQLMRSIMGSGGGGVIRIQGELGVQGDRLSYYIDEQFSLRESLSMY